MRTASYMAAANSRNTKNGAAPASDVADVHAGKHRAPLAAIMRHFTCWDYVLMTVGAVIAMAMVRAMAPRRCVCSETCTAWES